jgi:hypothetical protein
MDDDMESALRVQNMSRRMREPFRSSQTYPGASRELTGQQIRAIWQSLVVESAAKLESMGRYRHATRGELRLECSFL